MNRITTAYWQLHCSPQPDSACVPGYVMTDWTEEQLDQVTIPPPSPHHPQHFPD